MSLFVSVKAKAESLKHLSLCIFYFLCVAAAHAEALEAAGLSAHTAQALGSRPVSAAIPNAARDSVDSPGHRFA
ncbi:MAG: hypothetical protein ACTHNW_19965 [Mucilaginibacter sp.]